MQQQTIDIATPDNVGAAEQWSVQVAAAQAKLTQDQARAAQIPTILAGPAAQAADAAVTAAQGAIAAAQGVLDRARAAKSDADAAAARFAANDLANAQAAVDAATKAVGDELTQLLTAATTSAALTATIDGLAVRQRYRAAVGHTPPRWDMATIPLRAHRTDAPVDPQIRLPALDDTVDYPKLMDVLARHDDRVDAVADLVTAEGVHHLVNGNPVRAGAALDIAASGSVPDELDVVRTPVTGHDVTHRVMVLLDAAQQPRWAASAAGPAAQADPLTAAWVSTVLPDPATVGFVVDRLDPDTGVAGNRLALDASTLALDPLDWLRVAADQGELLARIARVARARWAGTLGEAAATGRVRVCDPTPPDPSRLALSDLLAAAAATRRALQTARALGAGDLLDPAASAPDTPAATAQGAVTAAETLRRHVGDIVSALQALTPASGVDAMVNALFGACALGVSEAAPSLDVATPTPAELQAQVAAAISRLAPRAQLPALAPAATGDLTLAAARERIAALCGRSLPLMVPVPAQPDATTQADLGPTPRAGAAPPDVRTWLFDHARVRPSLASLLECVELAEGLGCTARLDVRATQVPSTPGPWVGSLPAPPAGTGIVAVRGYGQALPASLTGLAVDTWVQTVPDGNHQTGLAFHFDEPDALPPQAVLVATAPDVSPGRSPATWDLDTLLDVVTSTLALASDRAVAAELVPRAGITVPDAPASAAVPGPRGGTPLT